MTEIAKRQYRVLVIGCGSIGQRHIGNLHELGMRSICGFDPVEDRSRQIKSKFAIETAESLEAAWAYEPEVVLITVPTALHVPLALEAASRRCHLFIEKPLSSSRAGIDRLQRAVKQSELITLVGCNLRFHPGLMTVKQLMDDGAVGHVIAARVEVGQYLPDWHPWEDYRESYSARRELGGGVILDAIHEIDYIRWLNGEVAAATCFAGKLSRLEIDTEDTAAILLRFANGAVGEVHVDYVQRAYSRSCQIIGEEGTLYWDYGAGTVRWFSAQTKEWKVYSNPPEWEPNQMYLDEMKHFLRCLAGKEDPAQDVFEAARVLQIALAARKSAQQQRWIKLRSQSWSTNSTL